MAGLLSAETVEAFERDGFVNAGTLLDLEEVEALRSELEGVIDASFLGKPSDGLKTELKYNVSVTANDSVYQTSALWLFLPGFSRAVRHEKIVKAGAELARSPTLQLWSDQVMYKPPERGGPVSWHQDAPYFESIEPAISLTAWISLDDADIESGCMWMVPGSHRWGNVEGHLWGYRNKQLEVADFRSMPPPDGLPELKANWQGPRPCVTRVGDVHFHHSLTWHGSPANRSNRPRRGYAIHYMPAGVVYNGKEDPRIATSGITARGTAMTEATGHWFPVVYDEGRVE